MSGPERSAPTLLVDADAFTGAEAGVEGDAYRHLFRAARLAVGDSLRVVDGRGRARWARVAAVDRRAARLALGEPAPANEAPREVELFTAPPRPQRAAWLVEKATEIGCTAVRFVAAERSPRGFGAGQIARLERVARSALEQCGRSRLPEVTGTHPFGRLGDLLAPLPARWVLDAAEPSGALAPGPEPCALVVGPEGGWSEAERRALAGHGCRPAGLGERILRVETAALAGAALLLLR